LKEEWINWFFIFINTHILLIILYIN
jgi:hypothetical protein